MMMVDELKEYKTLVSEFFEILFYNIAAKHDGRKQMISDANDALLV